MGEPHPFPRLRWAALAWLAGWAPAYALAYPLNNFLKLSDIAVVLTCAGLWLGSPLLLSSQAVSALVVDLLWDLDVAWWLATGRHLLGGTAYLWDARLPLWVRSLSLFHVILPALLLWALSRVGYDRRGWAVQSAIAAVAVAVSPLAGPAANVNFAFRDPLFHRAWGPAPVHLGVTLAVLVFVVYLPTHLVLARVFSSPARRVR